MSILVVMRLNSSSVQPEVRTVRKKVIEAKEENSATVLDQKNQKKDNKPSYFCKIKEFAYDHDLEQ